jgi:hypothetical protein
MSCYKGRANHILLKKGCNQWCDKSESFFTGKICNTPLTIENCVEDPNENSVIINVINNTSFPTLQVSLTQNIGSPFVFIDNIVVWQVLNFSQIGQTIELLYDPDIDVEINGKIYTVQIGNRYSLSNSNILSRIGSLSNSDEVQIVNNFSGSVPIKLFRNSKLIVNERTVSSGSEASFELPLGFRIFGLSSPFFSDGDLITTVNYSVNFDTTISTMGIRSQDIVVTDGFNYSLQNVVNL